MSSEYKGWHAYLIRPGQAALPNTLDAEKVVVYFKVSDDSGDQVIRKISKGIHFEHVWLDPDQPILKAGTRRANEMARQEVAFNIPLNHVIAIETERKPTSDLDLPWIDLWWRGASGNLEWFKKTLPGYWEHDANKAVKLNEAVHRFLKVAIDLHLVKPYRPE